MNKILMGALALGIAQPAMASDEDNKVFGEIGVGAGFSDTDLKFNNPTGTNFTSNTTTGDYIDLSEADNSDSSFTGYAKLGYRLSENFSVHTAYQYFGKFRASGSATFFGNDFEQTLSSNAHGLFVGLGANTDVGSNAFVEVTGDLGIGMTKSDGTQGANLGGPGVFPSASHSNFAWGVGAGLGYRLSNNVSLVARANYYDLGNADTAFSGPNANQIGMNTDERLETDLKTVTTTIGLRFNF